MCCRSIFRKTMRSMFEKKTHRFMVGHNYIHAYLYMLYLYTWHKAPVHEAATRNKSANSSYLVYFALKMPTQKTHPFFFYQLELRGWAFHLGYVVSTCVFEVNFKVQRGASREPRAWLARFFFPAKIGGPACCFKGIIRGWWCLVLRDDGGY